MRRGVVSKLNRKLDELRGLRQQLDLDGLQPLSSDPQLFNRQIGLPIHPSTNEPGELLPYQLDIAKSRANDILVVKANKIGITETILRRIIQKAVVGEYRGYQIMLAAQDFSLAKENMRRLQAIFEGSERLRKLIRGEPTVTRMLLVDGTEFLVMPRSARAIRGWPRLKCAFLDEAAHTGLLDDEPIFAAAQSRLANTNGDIIMVSTPAGRRGFFWRSYKAAKKGEINFEVYELPYHVALGRLITGNFITDVKATLGPLFAQEFECEFMAGSTAVFTPDLIRGAEQEYELDKPP